MTMDIPIRPLRDDTATTPCPVCDRPFPPVGRRRYCSDECRKTAWHRRHQPAPPMMTVPPARPAKPRTVYECPECDTRYLGIQYCPDCSVFCRRIGHGGLCPNCAEPVAIIDFDHDNVVG